MICWGAAARKKINSAKIYRYDELQKYPLSRYFAGAGERRVGYEKQPHISMGTNSVRNSGNHRTYNDSPGAFAARGGSRRRRTIAAVGLPDPTSGSCAGGARTRNAGTAQRRAYNTTPADGRAGADANAFDRSAFFASPFTIADPRASGAKSCLAAGRRRVTYKRLGGIGRCGVPAAVDRSQH